MSSMQVNLNNSNSLISGNNQLVFQLLSSQKTQIKSVEKDIKYLQNRLQLLKQHKEKQQHQLEKNKQKTDKLIKQKISAHLIRQKKQQYKQKQQLDLQLLKKKNIEKRNQHEKSMRDIMEACYLLKLDEARAIKFMSIEHHRKIKDIKQDINNHSVSRSPGIIKASQLRNSNHLKNHKKGSNNVLDISLNLEKNMQQLGNVKQQKARYLKSLQQQERKLLDHINKMQKQSKQINREMMVAQTIPAVDIAKAFSTVSKNGMQGSKSFEDRSQISNKLGESSQRKLLTPRINLKQEKLRHILLRGINKEQNEAKKQ